MQYIKNISKREFMVGTPVFLTYYETRIEQLKIRKETQKTIG